jgi:ABC-type branched-subunit amino acid transport system ATPase component
MGLRVEQLTKRFGGLLAVDCISFDVGEGEICAVIGPNGAGKTTLFSIIAGERKPDAGRVRLQDEDITGFADYDVARRGIGRSFQLGMSCLAPKTTVSCGCCLQLPISAGTDAGLRSRALRPTRR